MFSPSVCSSSGIYHKNKFVAVDSEYILSLEEEERAVCDTIERKIYREKSGVGISTTLLRTLGLEDEFRVTSLSGPLLRTITLYPLSIFYLPVCNSYTNAFSMHSFLSICRKAKQKEHPIQYSLSLCLSRSLTFRQYKKRCTFSRSFALFVLSYYDPIRQMSYCCCSDSKNFHLKAITGMIKERMKLT